MDIQQHTQTLPIKITTLDPRPPPPDILTFLVNSFCWFNFTYNFRLVTTKKWPRIMSDIQFIISCLLHECSFWNFSLLIIAHRIGQHVDIPETTLLSFKITKSLSSFASALRSQNRGPAKKSQDKTSVGL